jgi:hypothetical protein
MKNLKIWWLAWVCDYPFFRVIYSDGSKTYPIDKDEAFNLASIFNGKVKLDYSYARYYLLTIEN